MASKTKANMQEADYFTLIAKAKDKNNTQYIRKEDLDAAYRSMGLPETEEKLSNMIMAADADEDGRVSQNEFVRFMNRKHHPNPLSDVVNAFIAIAENDIPGKSFPAEKGRIHIDKLKYVMESFVEGFSQSEVESMNRHAAMFSEGPMVDYKKFAESFFVPHKR
eukprot:g3227.t1